ncbi:SagB/ThcOx family dehydrogenase [Candidatus Kaiserbacteria bacterium]|nr:SagB/ThcOx family dehydrogenase [Candidatus Kaiserbacteria bacterium]
MDTPNFSKIFHQSSKDHAKGHPPTPRRYEDWPEEWRTTYYKAYPRLPKIALEDGPPRADFFDLIKARQSRRDFTRASITKYELSVLLKYSCGTTGKLTSDRFRRAQASGGGRYPIEVYPIVFRSGEDLKAGLYHYNVKEHALDVLWDREFSDEDISQIFTYPWVKDATVGIVMTAVFWRNQNKYGERGYRQILHEAGHIGQNTYLATEALGLKCCALSGTRDENLEKLIDIDGVTESVVYALAVGR